MARNKIGDLRDHLFETIEMLKDDDHNEMHTAKANAIAKVAQTIINSAKLEVEYLKLVSKDKDLEVFTDFLEKSNGTSILASKKDEKLKGALKSKFNGDEV